MRKYLFYLLFFLLLGSPALSKMSLDQQRSLINSNAININLNCSNLLNRLGGFQGAITYSIGDAKKENHSYVLLHTHVKKENNIYYLCKKTDTIMRLQNQLMINLKIKIYIKYFMTHMKWQSIFLVLQIMISLNT